MLFGSDAMPGKASSTASSYVASRSFGLLLLTVDDDDRIVLVVAVHRFLSVLGVAGRIRVVAGRDRVAVANAPIATVGANFATAQVPDDLLGAMLGV